MTLESFFPDHDTSGNTITNDLFKAAAVLRLQELSEQTAEVKILLSMNQTGLMPGHLNQ